MFRLGVKSLPPECSHTTGVTTEEALKFVDAMRERGVTAFRFGELEVTFSEPGIFEAEDSTAPSAVKPQDAETARTWRGYTEDDLYGPETAEDLPL